MRCVHDNLRAQPHLRCQSACLPWAVFYVLLLGTCDFDTRFSSSQQLVMAIDTVDKIPVKISNLSPWMTMPRHRDHLVGHDTAVQQRHAKTPVRVHPIASWVHERPREAPWNGVQFFRLPTLGHPALSTFDAASSTTRTVAGSEGRGNESL